MGLTKEQQRQKHRENFNTSTSTVKHTKIKTKKDRVKKNNKVNYLEVNAFRAVRVAVERKGIKTKKLRIAKVVRIFCNEYGYNPEGFLKRWIVDTYKNKSCPELF